MNNSNSKSKIEVLAPCGSYDILVAAVHAGADACYIGGNRFGARAYAENFDEPTTIRAISYAHLHGVKLYLTVNTLFKQDEITQLYDYLKPYYEAGLDAVIVQDLGVFSYIRAQFPDLPIHCSTQMNITSVHGAALMAKQGAKRIVTAREMPLSEIIAIKENVDVEVETFVHGAMCYSYSGQCLMSSLAGGRSGNRGRCAQPCRQCFDGSYVLSMKDLCSLEHIPKLLDAGIDSLKIEGRMKNAAYVASAVHAYKTIVEDCQKGVYDEKKAEAFKNELANIYNRGGFTDGYFFRHNGKEMISVTRPNNQGVRIGTITGIQSGTIRLRLSADLYKQDVLELTGNGGEVIEITSGIYAKSGDTVTLNCPKTKKLKMETTVYRTKCPKLVLDIQDNYIEHYKKQPLSMHFTAKVGEPLSLMLETTIDSVRYTAHVDGAVVEQSKQTGLSRDAIQKPLCQLGNTDYQVSDVVLDFSQDAFVPAGNIKKLRREAIEKLGEAIINHGKRTCQKPCDFSFTGIKTEEDTKNNYQRLLIGVSNREQLEAVLQTTNQNTITVSGITMPYSVFKTMDNYIQKQMKTAGIKCYLELPHVITASDCIEQNLQRETFGGIYIRNIDGLAIAADIAIPPSWEILCDASLYCYNLPAISFVKRLLGKSNPISFLLPRELSVNELQTLSDEPLCMALYEYQPVMVTANCTKRTTTGCNQKNSIRKIRDDKGNVFYEQSFCEHCYNVIYNGIPLSLFDKYTDAAFSGLHSCGYTIRFTIEPKEDVLNVLSAYCSAMHGEAVQLQPKTNGHLYRGVL